MKTFLTFLAVLLVTGVCFSQSLNNYVELDSKEVKQEATALYVRKNVNTAGGQEDLAAMAHAFYILEQRGCDNGLSWYYQGAIHNIPNLISGTNELCDSYQNSSDKKFGWGDCTHISSDASDLHFLLWHRMYTWHLEKIVRELSGKADFALPYWNYGSLVESDNIMDVHFRTASNPLYEAARYSRLNNGEPIDQETVTQIHTQLGVLAQIPTFSGSAGFSKSVEISPHNLMHGYIGSGPDGETMYNKIFQKVTYGLMAQVPSAGFDPIFWLHHSMIDRIWAQWDASPIGVRPTLAELQAEPWTYNFIQPDGSRITYTMDQLYNTVFNLDYTYDILVQAPALAAADNKQTMAMAARPMKKKDMSYKKQPDPKETQVWKHKVGQVIKHEKDNSFNLSLNSHHHKQTNKLLRTNKDQLMILTLDVSVYKEPRSHYTVYLRYPNREDQYIGKMTFFGVGHTHGDEKSHSLNEEGAALQFSYYVHEHLTRNQEFEVIIKKHGRDEAKVTLESVSLSTL